MNDVLAKPFTKDGMIRILRKHVTHLLKNPPPPGSSGDDMMAGTPQAGHPGPAAGYASTTMSMASIGGPPSVATSSSTVKYETTPIQSPATSTSWHSPSQLQQTSPHMDGGGFLASAVNGGQALAITPGGTQRPTFPGGPAPPMGNPPIRGLPDGMGGDDRPEKRQRLYGPPGQAEYAH